MKIDEQQTQNVGSLVAGLADEAMSVIGLQLENEDMRRRFHAIVESFFKDLRDAVETKSKLTLAKPSGGLGLTDEQADRVMGTLTVKQAEFDAAMRERLQTERKAFVAQRAEKQMTERDDFERSEKTDLDRRYAKLTGTELPALSGVEGPPEPRAPSGVEGKLAVRPIQPPKVIPVVQEPKEAGKSGSGEAGKQALTPALSHSAGEGVREGVPPAGGVGSQPSVSGPRPQVSSAPAAPAKADAFDGFFGKEKTQDARLKTQAAPASVSKPGLVPPPPAPKFSGPPVTRPTDLATAPLPRTPSPALPSVPAAGKPVVSDVKAAPARLTGPVEELRSISVRDFRHLSKVPTEATLKIKDKIDLLEEQSFPQKTAGIVAWRESPTNKLYLDILRQSLEGIPVADVIGKMELEGKETLTKAEFDAIMGLNRTLRFG